MTSQGRVRALRRAWRTFWWMVVRPKPGQSLTRRTELGIALRQARCGLLTGGEHSWGPLIYEYKGARRRKQMCRWCRASMTPASEITEPTVDEREQWERFLPTHPPSDEDVRRAIALAEKAGILRNGRWVWE